MGISDRIRCRVAACREALDDGKEWSFYLINDSEVRLDSAVLYAVGYEWGDWGNSEDADVCVADLAPGAHALIWRDDGSGAELRMDLSVRVRVPSSDVRKPGTYGVCARFTGTASRQTLLLILGRVATAGPRGPASIAVLLAQKGLRRGRERAWLFHKPTDYGNKLAFSKKEIRV